MELTLYFPFYALAVFDASVISRIRSPRRGQEKAPTRPAGATVKEVKLMKNTTDGLFLPPWLPRNIRQNTYLSVAIFSFHEMMSDLGDFLIDKWETLRFDLTETINKRLISVEPCRVRPLCKVFRFEP